MVKKACSAVGAFAHIGEAIKGSIRRGIGSGEAELHMLRWDLPTSPTEQINAHRHGRYNPCSRRRLPGCTGPGTSSKDDRCRFHGHKGVQRRGGRDHGGGPTEEVRGLGTHPRREAEKGHQEYLCRLLIERAVGPQAPRCSRAPTHVPRASPRHGRARHGHPDAVKRGVSGHRDHRHEAGEDGRAFCKRSTTGRSVAGPGQRPPMRPISSFRLDFPRLPWMLP